MPAQDTDFSEFARTRIALFVFDPIIRKHAVATLRHLGFEEVTDHDVPRNYFEALSRLVPIIAGDRDLIIHNLPPKPRPGAKSGEEAAVYDQLNSAYLDIKSNLSKRHADPMEPLSKTVPVLEVGDYLRDKLIDVLFRYRVPAAFFMSAVESTRHLSKARKAEQMRENFQTHFKELTTYLNQYFRDKDELVAMADERLSEQDLSQRKKQYDGLMADARELKTKGDFEAAISLLKQAITVFPKNIEAYLESGRLYMRRREYGRALTRFGQAEDLFVDAPEPNKEIANMRLTQVKERVEAGEDPNSREIKALLAEVVENFEDAHRKAVEMVDKHQGDPDFEQPIAVGQDILKWNAAEFLGPKHPAVQRLLGVVQKSTAGLTQLNLEELTTGQCLALGLQALENGDLVMSQMYYFRALKDQERFTEVCSEINYVGMRLRTMDRIDDAIKIYQRLLKHNPHNKGSVFWNMAVAYAFKQDHLNAAGHAAQCLYVDPAVAREDDFYQSLTPQLMPILLRMMRTLRLSVIQGKTFKPSSQLVQLYQAREMLVRRINESRKGEALKLFLKLVRHPSRFALKPDFHGDGLIAGFVIETRDVLIKKGDPKYQPAVKTITAWLKYIQEHPVQPRLARYLGLARAALQALELRGDQQLAAFHLGQALVVIPESYFNRPDFYAQETLPALARELAGKFKFVDAKRFPKWKRGTGAGAAGPTGGP